MPLASKTVNSVPTRAKRRMAEQGRMLKPITNGGDNISIVNALNLVTRLDANAVIVPLSAPASPETPALVNDRVALSIATGLVKHTSDSAASDARVQQLKNAIEAHQFDVHPLAVSLALIEAHLVRE